MSDYKKLAKKYRLSKNTIMWLEMKSPEQIIKEKGLAPGGDVRRFHTANVLNRIVKYIPHRTGMTVKATLVQTNVNKPYIITNTPFAKYLYYGKVMVGKAPKVATDKPLRYTKPNTGPYWDRALKAAELPAMQADLQRCINRRAGKR